MRRRGPVIVAPAARWRWPGWAAAWPAIVTVAVTALLFGLGVTNVVIRATWHEADDGVLWVSRLEGVTAFGVAPGTPAGRAGIRPGDLLEAIDGQFVERPSDVANLLRRGTEGQPVTYRLLRLGTAEAFEFRLASVTRGNTSLYYVLAPVGLFHAARRGHRPPAAGRITRRRFTSSGSRRPSSAGRPSRSAAGSIGSTGSSTGPTRQRCSCCRRCFLHFTFFFPERPLSWATGPFGNRLWRFVYLPALLLGVARVTAIARAVSDEHVLHRRGRAGARPVRAALPVGVPGLAAGGHRARVPRGADGHLAAAAALDCVGHGARGAALRVRLRPAVRDGGRARRCRWSCRPFRSA